MLHLRECLLPELRLCFSLGSGRGKEAEQLFRSLAGSFFEVQKDRGCVDEARVCPPAESTSASLTRFGSVFSRQPGWVLVKEVCWSTPDVEDVAGLQASRSSGSAKRSGRDGLEDPSEQLAWRCLQARLDRFA